MGIVVGERVAKMVENPCCDLCEHVEADHSLAVKVYTETDSFGPVGWYAVCWSCMEQHDKAEDEREVKCHDCGKYVPKKQTMEWKSWDFYAAQGDEPIVVCNTCRCAEKHKDRVAQDDYDYKVQNGIIVEETAEEAEERMWEEHDAEMSE